MVLVLDRESTTKNTGHPFTKTNKLVLVGLGNDIFKIEYDNEPYGENLTKIQSLIDGASLLVGFNLKHDLHWLRRYGIKLGDSVIGGVAIIRLGSPGQRIRVRVEDALAGSRHLARGRTALLVTGLMVGVLGIVGFVELSAIGDP